jgi:hypothetical protein
MIVQQTTTPAADFSGGPGTTSDSLANWRGHNAAVPTQAFADENINPLEQASF